MRTARKGQRLLAFLAAILTGAAVMPLVIQSPAAAWSQYVSTSIQYYTHGGRLYIYADGLAVNWGCSGGGLVMDCAEAQNVYQTVQALDTYTDAVQVQSAVSFTGSALSVGLPIGAGGSASGNTCYSQVFSASGTFVSAYTNGAVCHAQTYLAVTGMTLWAWGYGRWGNVWDGTSTSTFISMYPR